MTEKYKLIKWYPSIHDFYDIGDEVEFEEDQDFIYAGTMHGHKWALTRQEVENSPEFWQPVKQYQILQMMAASGSILTFNKEGICTSRSDDLSPGYTHSLQKSLELGASTIYQVRRLTDGEVFTVGDEVTSMEDQRRTIIGFRRSEKFNYLMEVDLASAIADLTSLNHAPEKVLTTEDGLDIYDGDSYYVPQKDFNGRFRNAVRECIASKARDYSKDDSKRFSDRQKAKNYIRDIKSNKFSKEDIIMALEESKVNLGKHIGYEINHDKFLKQLNIN